MIWTIVSVSKLAQSLTSLRVWSDNTGGAFMRRMERAGRLWLLDQPVCVGVSWNEVSLPGATGITNTRQHTCCHHPPVLDRHPTGPRQPAGLVEQMRNRAIKDGNIRLKIRNLYQTCSLMYENPNKVQNKLVKRQNSDRKQTVHHRVLGSDICLSTCQQAHRKVSLLFIQTSVDGMA